MTKPLAALVFFVALTSAAALPAAAAPAQVEVFPEEDLAAAEWSQVGANATGRASCTLKPLTSPPAVLWEADLGEVIAEPLHWAGRVYVLVERSHRRKLHVLDARDGSEVAKLNVARGDFAAAAVWDNRLCLVEEGRLQVLELRSGRLRRVARHDGEWGAPPTAYAGKFYAATKRGKMHVFDAHTGEAAGEPGQGHGKPTVWLLEGKPNVFSVGCAPSFERAYVRTVDCSWYDVDGEDERQAMSLKGVHADVSVDFLERHAEFHTVYVGDYIRPQFHVQTPRGFRVEDQACPGMWVSGAMSSRVAITDIAHPTAVVDNLLFGFSSAGGLLIYNVEGSFGEVLTSEQLPKGARPGPMSAARNVLFVGNWAFDYDTSRVLWCLPDLEAVTRAVPTGDERLVVGTAEGLVCLGPGKAPVEAVASATPSAAAPPPAVRPDSSDGVVRADGVFVPGAVESDRSRVTLTPPDGEPLTFTLQHETALFVADGAGNLVGEEYPVFLAWQAALQRERRGALRETYEAYVRGRFVEKALEVVAELRDGGLTAEEAAELERRVADKRENTAANADAQKERIAREHEARERAVWEGYLAGVAWCREVGAPLAASTLLAEAARLPARDQDEIDRLVTELVPDPFPWRNAGETKNYWLVWAPEILPAGGRFVPLDDKLHQYRANPPWNDGTIVLRTDSIAILSRVYTPSVVGACLRNGEGTVRTLRKILRGRSPKEPLKIFLHRNREEYLAEEGPTGVRAQEWMAGHYSAADQVSRFYVTRDEKNRPLQRSLYQVLAHELTHHYIEQEWARASAAPEVPGFWVVEGVARFIEDQVVELGRVGGGLADETVSSLDASSKVAQAKRLIPLARLMDMNHAEFSTKLGDTPIARFQLRNTIGELELTERSLFYEQAGSLAFYLFHSGGEELRERFVKYLRDHYRGRTKPGAWTELGYGDVEELEAGFQEFLEGL